MALTYKQGSFTSPGATGNQTIDTGSGVTGQALILFGSYSNATGFSVGMSGFQSFCKSSTARKCLSWAATDAVVALSQNDGGYENLAVRLWSPGTPISGSPAVDGAADFVDFTTGGAGRFTINWSAFPATTREIGYIMLGGGDLTNVALIEGTPRLIDVGTKAYTGVGFQGDCVLFMGRAVTVTGTAAGLNHHLGAAVSSTQRGCIRFGERDSMSAGAEHHSNNAACLHIPTQQGLAVDALADFVSFDSDGFTLNWTDFAASAWLFAALVLKGGRYAVNEILAPTSTGTQSITTVAEPNGVYFFGTGQTTANATDGAEAHICIGAGGESPIEELAMWTSADNTVDSDTNRAWDTAKCIKVATNPSTVAAEADFNSVTSTSYVLNWTTTRLNSRFFGVAFMNAVAAPEEYLWNVSTPPPREPVVMVYG